MNNYIIKNRLAGLYSSRTGWTPCQAKAVRVTREVALIDLRRLRAEGIDGYVTIRLKPRHVVEVKRVVEYGHLWHVVRCNGIQLDKFVSKTGADYLANRLRKALAKAGGK